MYREGEVEDFLDEVGGGDGAQHSLDAVLLLLHVCLFVQLKDKSDTNKQKDMKQRINLNHAAEYICSFRLILQVVIFVSVSHAGCSLTFNIVSNVALSPCFSTVKYTCK